MYEVWFRGLYTNMKLSGPYKWKWWAEIVAWTKGTYAYVKEVK